MTISTQDTQKNDYISQLKGQLEEWTKIINAIKTRVENRSLQVRNDYHHDMAEWKAKREILIAKLDEILKHSGNNFETLRYGTQKARFDVLIAYKKLSAIS